MANKQKKIISRWWAADRGLTRYYTDSICKNGHLAERYTLTAVCVACANERMSIYREKFRANYFKNKARAEFNRKNNNADINND